MILEQDEIDKIVLDNGDKLTNLKDGFLVIELGSNTTSNLNILQNCEVKSMNYILTDPNDKIYEKKVNNTIVFNLPSDKNMCYENFIKNFILANPNINDNIKKIQKTENRKAVGSSKKRKSNKKNKTHKKK